MHSQQYFDFGLDFVNDATLNDSFIISLCNLEAVNAIDNFETWPDKRLLVLGEKGSGKSLLSSRFIEKTGGIELKPNSIGDLAAIELSAQSGVVIENIHAFYDEEELFHIINYCKNNELYLLMTAKQYPSFKTRDLRSRLDSTCKAIIKTPDEELCRILLKKAFAQRQLTVSDEMVEYLLLRIERSFEAIWRISQILDSSSLAQGKAINYKLINSVL